MEKTHWKALSNRPYMGAWDLQPGAMPDVTIRGVNKGMAKANSKAPEEEVTVLFFNEYPKGLILNTENSETITEILGTPYVQDWVGRRIKLFVKSGVKKPGQKKTVEAIRVSKTLPLPLESDKKELTPAMVETWKNAVSALKNGKSIDVIKSRYILSEENELKLSQFTTNEKGV